MMMTAPRSTTAASLRGLRVAAPLVEVDRVHGAKVDRQLRVLEPHRHQHAAVRGVARLAAHPARIDRARRPDHDQRAGALELARNQRVELIARRNLRVPPDGPALRLERSHERGDQGFVLPRIGNENVGQNLTCPTPRREA